MKNTFTYKITWTSYAIFDCDFEFNDKDNFSKGLIFFYDIEPFII